MNRLHILILDDEPRIREELNDFLTDEGYHVFEAGTPLAAMEICQQKHIDIAIVDINLPEKDGLSVLQELKNRYPNIEVLIVTGQGDMDIAIQAMRLGAADFFNKPIRLGEVLVAIERTNRFIKLHKQFLHISSTFDQLSEDLQAQLGFKLIGNSLAHQKIVADIQTAAANPDTPVMIIGESGTGKELVARSIHQLSSRRRNFFYAVNCAAIPDSLFESEFFGYSKGAFTGAATAKAGWFESADKGTLFLDEIGDMNALMQAKLLRISEDGKVRRIGANKDTKVDVRIVTATNRNIEEMVKDGSFRKDLFHRVNTFQIKLPPLRERTDDIPILVEHFMQHFSTKTGKRIEGIQSSLLDRLCSHHFPGNIRELKNVIERAVIVCNTRHITSDHFAPGFFECEPTADNSEQHTELYNLEILEKQAICRALKKTCNNKRQAAKLLHISWQALERRMEKYGMR